ncbi:MAG TPA: glycosyltransferase family 2 protein [Gemmatimonadales bacterium]|nr:glycosyltransferase family 2 protein [Gemmatimonadales bacterium]
MPERVERLAVVVPAYRAAGTVAAVVTGIGAAAPGSRVYVVDDGSDDGTGGAAAAAGATVLTHARNAGKGSALATGIARALADGANFLVTLDADGQHPPEAIPAVVAPVSSGRADLVIGCRRREGAMPYPRRLSNWLSTALAARIGGQPMLDSQSGFRAFTRALAAAVRPAERRYDYETAFLLGALAAGFRATAVPIPTIYGGAPSHFNHVADTWRVARVYARYGWRLLRGGR